jgi:hypothetical protein
MGAMEVLDLICMGENKLLNQVEGRPASRASRVMKLFAHADLPVHFFRILFSPSTMRSIRFQPIDLISSLENEIDLPCLAGSYFQPPT